MKVNLVEATLNSQIAFASASTFSSFPALSFAFTALLLMQNVRRCNTGSALEGWLRSTVNMEGKEQTGHAVLFEQPRKTERDLAKALPSRFRFDAAVDCCPVREQHSLLWVKQEAMMKHSRSSLATVSFASQDLSSNLLINPNRGHKLHRKGRLKTTQKSITYENVFDKTIQIPLGPQNPRPSNYG